VTLVTELFSPAVVAGSRWSRATEGRTNPDRLSAFCWVVRQSRRPFGTATLRRPMHPRRQLRSWTNRTSLAVEQRSRQS